MYVPTDNLKTFMEQNPETYKGIFPEHQPLAMNIKLKEIAALEDGWDGDNAQHFSKHLIKKCDGILNELHVTPFISPTLNDSIQFEWDKDNGDYLEIEIFSDKCVVFKMYNDGRTSEYEAKEDELKNIVKDFFS